jgi:hypothetical protein
MHKQKKAPCEGGNEKNRKQSKATKYRNQFSEVYRAFFERPRTMKEVDLATGVMRESVCRYVGRLRNEGLISVIRKRYCQVTKHLAGEYTTNPKLFPNRPKQLNLWK